MVGKKVLETSLDLTIAEQARRAAEAAGVKLPCNPERVSYQLRSKIAGELGTRVHNVNLALKAKRRARSPEELAKFAERRGARGLDPQLGIVVKRREVLAAKALARVEKARLEAERKLQMHMDRLSKAEARAAEAAARAAKRKPVVAKRSKRESVEHRFPSQQRKQIAAIRLGVGDEWMVDGLEARRKATEAATGVAMTVAKVVRKALVDVFEAGGPSEVVKRQYGETTHVIGPMRLPDRYRVLPAQISKAAKRLDCSEADLIRSALVEWLVGKGHGKKGKR